MADGISSQSTGTIFDQLASGTHPLAVSAPTRADVGKVSQSATGTIFDDLASGQSPIKSAPTTPPATTDADTGVWAGIKRNTVGAIAGLHDVFTRPADADEQAAIGMAKANPTLAGVPDQVLLAAHRLLVQPAEQTGQQAANTARRALASAESGKYGEALGEGADAAATGALAVVPMAGPWINSVANRGSGVGVSGTKERPRDISGAATDLAFGVALENAPEIARTIKGVGKGAKTAEAAEMAKATEAAPKDFVYREPTPAPQHGAPVEVASPLDNATINKLPGGKDLSPEAVEALKAHIGGGPGAEIEVGSSPKNTLMKAVQPIQKTLADTGIKMNQVIADAPEFRTNTITDPNSAILQDLNDVRDNLPLREDDPLNKVVDKQLEAAYPALESTDPQEVLAARRTLGNQIDWNNITNSPETAGEAKNLVQAKIYKALGNKIHSEIPETVELDKVFQPNLELQSHLDAKLGRAVSRDPLEAESQRLSELKKGKAQIDNAAHNEIVAKNRELAGRDESDVKGTVGTKTVATPVTDALEEAVGKFNIPAVEQDALHDLIQPNMTPGRLYGANTKWYGALKDFDALEPQEQAARFSDPMAVRNVLRKQAAIQFSKAAVKYGTIAVAAHELGIDKPLLRAIGVVF